MINQVISFDIEVYPNLWEIGLKDFKTKEVWNLEISEENDDRKAIYDFFTKYNGYLIGFNTIHYDNLVIKYFLKNYSKLSKLPKNEFLTLIKSFSDKVIDQENNFDYLKPYRYFNQSWIDIDLYLFWSRMLRISKKISLKSLAVQLDYKQIQELPYNPSTILTKEELQEVRLYNNNNDLGILDLLAERMRDEIKLRLAIKKDYNLDCMSWDAIKIASEALLQDYCKETGKDIKETRYQKQEKSTIYIKDILKDFNPDFELPIFQDLYNSILNSIDSFSEEIPVIYNNTSIRLSYGVGGIHSVNENEIYKSTKTHKIITSDVASLYPNLIINYKCIRFPEVLQQYIRIKDERIIAKKNKVKLKDTFFKLILNGVSGLLDNHHSWLYYPEGALRLRLIGQLVLTKLIEVCLMNNWQVISANTDGVEVIIPTNEIDSYYSKVEKLQKQFNLDFEHEEYNKIVYSNVNNYICITKKGKLKKKGFYKTKEEIPLGDSVNELIIPLALQEYFIHNIPIEKTIKEQSNIYLYTASKKINKDYDVFYNGLKVQNLNRYYFSFPAPYLLKKKKTKINANLEHINVGEPILLFNKFEERQFLEYNIDFVHYIKKCRKIIDSLEIKQKQLSLF